MLGQSFNMSNMGKVHMEIMYLIFSFNVGGIERLLVDMTSKECEKGYKPLVCIINDDYDAELVKTFDEKVELIFLGRENGKNLIKYMAKFASIVKSRKVNILHCQGINCVLFSLFAKLINRKMVIINTVHDVGNYPSYSNLKLFVQGLILDSTVAISKAVEQEILARENRKRVITIYNAVDLDKFKKSTKVFDKNNVMVGNVARFYPQKKGQDILVRAIKKINDKEGYEVTCKFAGEVFKEQDHDYERIVEYISENSLENKIIMCGGVDNIPAFLNQLDLFVLPSRYEGFGIALIEALAMGIPVVASDIDGPKEIYDLAKQENVDIGYLAKTGDDEDVCKKIKMCLVKYSQYDKNSIREFVSRHFSIEHMVEQHLLLYSSLLKRK